MDENVKSLPKVEIRAILRAADEIIAQGGRTLLAKILKGSREKKILELQLNTCPVYGYFGSHTIKEITEKIDWMIDYDFLAVEYFGKLPMIVFTDRGWLIESDQQTDELLNEWYEWLKEEKTNPDMTYLKDRNRGMILSFLEKVKETRERRFIPYLEAWEKIEYKKVRTEIRKTIKAIQSQEEIDSQQTLERTAVIDEALEGEAPRDLLLKCWECGERFIFTVGEQKFYQQKGFVYPKRCEDCRQSDYV